MDDNLVQGTVVLFGTPAEESSSGKINFVKEGLIKDNVDVALMLVSGLNLSPGCIVLKRSCVTA